MHAMINSGFDDTVLLSFLLVENIDSLQKLRLLLFLHEHQHLCGTSQDFAQRLYIGDTVFFQEILTELIITGLVLDDDNYYTLSADPFLLIHLDYLAQAFADPLTRQELLAYFNHETRLTSMAKRVLQNY